MAHKTGPSREQMILFPESLDEAVGSDDPVRVIDAFVDSLDLAQLGFSKVVAEELGRPPYAPRRRKLYVYGYLNRVRSSRRLAAEAQRNVEVMWLTGRAAPAFKTVADFRKDHPEAIVGVCRKFVRSAGSRRWWAARCLRSTARRSMPWQAASRWSRPRAWGRRR